MINSDVHNMQAERVSGRRRDLISVSVNIVIKALSLIASVYNTFQD